MSSRAMSWSHGPGIEHAERQAWANYMHHRTDYRAATARLWSDGWDPPDHRDPRGPVSRAMDAVIAYQNNR